MNDPRQPRFLDGKEADALRTIGEVADALGIKQHVLRYWEQQFPMLRPLKRSGARRYYRRADVELVATIDRLIEVARTDPIAIDLESQTVTTRFQERFTFEIDPFRKDCLLGGLDEVGLTLARDAQIAGFEARRAAETPWL